MLESPVDTAAFEGALLTAMIWTLSVPMFE